jgi:hypothetical protein
MVWLKNNGLFEYSSCGLDMQLSSKLHICHQIYFIIDGEEKVPLLTSLDERSKGTTFSSFDTFEFFFYVQEAQMVVGGYDAHIQ